MIRVRALNESSNDVRTEKDKVKSRETKEAQEVQAYDWYNTALLLLKNKCFDQASEKFNQILKTSLVTEAASTLVDEEGEAIEKPLKNPGLVLKYSTHKNLAAMESEQGNLTAAMEHYLEAVKLDTTDVTLWLTIGTHAVSLGRFYLAKHAFNCGLQCNQLHWPCMDHLITVLFILYDFEGCLMWIAKALEREPGYTKAIVFRDQIFNLCPHLQRDTYHLFRLCSSAIYDVQVEDEITSQYLQEAEDLRERHRQACLPDPLDDVTMNRLTSLDWHSLGSSLLIAYQQIMTSSSSSSNMGLHSKVKVGDLPACRTMLNNIKLKRKDKTNNSVVAVGVGGETRATPPVMELISEEESVDSHLSHMMTSTMMMMETSPNKKTTQMTSLNCDDDDVAMMTSSHDNDDVVKCIMEEMVTAIEEHDDVINSDVRRTMDDLVRRVEKSVATSASAVIRDDDGKKKRKRKNLSAANQLEDFKKRRSTRNRTTKKVGDVIAPLVDEAPNKSPQSKQSYIELIKEVIPQNMIKLYDKSTYKKSHDKTATSDSTDDGGKTRKEKKKDTTATQSVECNKYDVIEEAEDVIMFIEVYQHKTIIEWLQQYCRVFVTKKDVRWRKGIRELLVKISNIILPHVTYPDPDDVTKADYKWIRGVLLQILTCIECQVDLVTSSGGGSGNNFNLIVNKLEYLSSMVPKYEIYDDDVIMWEEFVLRVQWCKYKFACAIGDNDEAMTLLSSCSVIITAMEKQRNNEVVINLPNHSSYQSISNKVMMAKMQEYERSQLLDDVNGYFDRGEYTNVVSLLLPTLLQQSPTQQHPARAKQLRHLMVAQWKVADRMESLSAMSNIINEISNRLMKRSGEKGNLSKEMMTQQKLKDWKNTLNVLLKYLDEYLVSTSSEPFKHINEENLSNLIHGLINIVDYLLNYATQMSIDPSMLINSLTVLYRIANSMLDDDGMIEDPSIFRANLLSSLHDWAGEKRLCCAKDGYLLRLITSELSIPSKDSNSFGLVYDMNMDSCVQDCLEQTFFCMFTYPQRTRANNFDDHFARMKKVTWYDYVNLFNYSKQPDLPQFDSMKVVTINADFAQQIQKALLLLPPHLQEQVRINEDRINLYLDSHCTSSPMTSLPSTDDITTTRDDVMRRELSTLGCMYYLFADFKFKKNELPTAVKFYMHDLALTPNRIDSWAGIALSKSGLTENILRSCNKTSVVETEREAQLAIACFQQALSIDGDNVKLWIEYGSFAYWLQAMYSRRISRIKRSRRGEVEEEEEMDDDGVKEEDVVKKQQRIIEILEKKKQKMQQLSRHCFETVEKCDDSDEVNDEEWLIEYMIGKHDEKEGKPPSMYLRHYQQAAVKLHNRGAKYPKKIQTRYTQGTNELSGEALEMYYRLHASALSYVNQYSSIFINQQPHDDEEKLPTDFVQQLEYIKETLDETTRCPFVQRAELKSSTSSTTQSSTSNSQEDKNKQQSSKLSGGVTESKDFIIGSLVPDSIQQALNYHVDIIKDDTDSQQSHSPQNTSTPSSGSQSREGVATSGQHHTAASVTNKEATNAVVVAKQREEQQQVVISKSQLIESVVMVIDLCEKAFRLCLRRYPQHYKAVYRLAGIYMTWSHKQNLEWARDLLYGTSTWSQLSHMPSQGLMAERNKTNLFNGVWRISDDDVDRPGSFSTHLERCVGMLLYILRRLHDNKTLLHIHNLLNRIPDQGRQYLKDVDRTRLARRAVVYSRSIVRYRIHNNRVTTNMTSQQSMTTTNNISYQPLARDFYQPDEDFTRGSPPSAVAVVVGHCDVISVVEQQQKREICSQHQHELSKLQSNKKQMENPTAATVTTCDQQQQEENNLLKTLMDAYKIYQDTNRHPSSTMRVDISRDSNDCSHQRLLAEAYHKYTTCLNQQENVEDDTKENELSPPTTTTTTDSRPITDTQVITLVEKAKVFCQQKHRQMYSNKSTTSNNNSTDNNTTNTQQQQSSTTPVTIMKRPLIKPPQVVLTPISTSPPSSSTKEPCTVKFGICTDNKKSSEVVLTEGMSGGKVTMVKKDGQTYTKIQPKPMMSGAGSKRNNLGFVHLQIPQQDVDSRQELRRSSSVPLADEGSLHIRHRALFRTGSSVSDSTKLILRSTIQQGKSAALIRKPSITDHEIQQIHDDDDDENDDDDDDDDMSGWSDDDDELPPCKKIMKSDQLATTSSSVVVKPDQPMSPLQQVITMTTTAAT